MRWASLSFWAGRLELSPARSPQRGRLSAISGSALLTIKGNRPCRRHICAMTGRPRASVPSGSPRGWFEPDRDAIALGSVECRWIKAHPSASGSTELLHASDQNQITLTPRHVILMLFVASARARGSRVCVFGHQFLDGRRLAGQVSGPGQLMRTMRFRRLTWESSSILSRHRCVSFKSDARSSPWRARSSSPSRHRSTQASVVASAGAVGEVFPIIVSEQQAGT